MLTVGDGGDLSGAVSEGFARQRFKNGNLCRMNSGF